MGLDAPPARRGGGSEGLDLAVLKRLFCPSALARSKPWCAASLLAPTDGASGSSTRGSLARSSTCRMQTRLVRRSSGHGAAIGGEAGDFGEALALEQSAWHSGILPSCVSNRDYGPVCTDKSCPESRWRRCGSAAGSACAYGPILALVRFKAELRPRKRASAARPHSVMGTRH